MATTIRRRRWKPNRFVAIKNKPILSDKSDITKITNFENEGDKTNIIRTSAVSNATNIDRKTSESTNISDNSHTSSPLKLNLLEELCRVQQLYKNSVRENHLQQVQRQRQLDKEYGLDDGNETNAHHRQTVNNHSRPSFDFNYEESIKNRPSIDVAERPNRVVEKGRKKSVTFDPKVGYEKKVRKYAIFSIFEN